MLAIFELRQVNATRQQDLLARTGRTMLRFVAAIAASVCMVPSVWAIPTTTLSPGGAQNTIALSRAATNGAFSVDYDFTLTTAASAIYNTGRFNLADSPIGALLIHQFNAQLFLLIGNAISGGALATGIDSDHLGYMLSSDFFAASLAPGDYRLSLSGIDEDSGYDGVFRVAPPAQVRFAAQVVPEPQSWALLLIALGTLALARRRATARGPRLAALRVASRVANTTTR